jgi:hypothetical protein
MPATNPSLLAMSSAATANSHSVTEMHPLVMQQEQSPMRHAFAKVTFTSRAPAATPELLPRWNNSDAPREWGAHVPLTL